MSSLPRATLEISQTLSQPDPDCEDADSKEQAAGIHVVRAHLCLRGLVGKQEPHRCLKHRNVCTNLDPLLIGVIHPHPTTNLEWHSVWFLPPPSSWLQPSPKNKGWRPTSHGRGG